MGSPEFSRGIRVTDLALDDEGRVTIRDPALARLIASNEMDLGSTQAANNCHGGNCAKGCGTKVAEEEVLPA